MHCHIFLHKVMNKSRILATYSSCLIAYLSFGFLFQLEEHEAQRHAKRQDSCFHS